MRVLAVRQPWASLLALGKKPVENRGWSTEYRGDVAIHASKKPDLSPHALAMLAKHLPMTCVHKLPHGQIIGLVELYGVTRDMDGEWFSGPVGLLVRNARQLQKGLPHKGTQSMVEAGAYLEQRILRNL
jgi:hypothetical protein